MHIVRSKFTGDSGRIYQTILLRESYRERKKVKKRTVVNLIKCSENEMAAIEFALRHKANLTELGLINDSKITGGLS